jgi:hypothetical protein
MQIRMVNLYNSLTPNQKLIYLRGLEVNTLYIPRTTNNVVVALDLTV